MTCEWVEGKLSAYVEDALDPQEREEVRAHLETCADCQALLDDYRNDELLLRGLVAPEPPAGMRERFFSSPEYIKLTRRLEHPRTPARVWMVRGAIPAAALIAVGLGVGLALHARTASPTTHSTGKKQTIGAPSNFNFPLAPGQRLIFLRGGALWSAPEKPTSAAATASAPQQLTPANAQVAAWAVAPASGGSAGKLVAWVDGKTGQLHLVRADGLTDTVVARIAPAGQTLSQATLSGLAWSPDGTKLAFVSEDASGALTLHILTVSGPNTTSNAQIGAATTLGKLAGTPVWSADGQSLAWATTNSDGSTSVWSARNGAPTQVAALANTQQPQATVASLGWSGRALTWATTSGGQITGVFSAIPGASSVTRLTPASATYTAAALGPNGAWLLAAQNTLWRVPAGASAPEWAATLASPVSAIVWSPDGKAAALLGSGSAAHLTVWSASAGQTTVTTSAASDVTPVWSPDSASLAYVANGRVALTAIQQGKPATTETGGAVNGAVDLLWSADGSTVAITGSHGVYLATSNGLILTIITSYAPNVDVTAWSTAG